MNIEHKNSVDSDCDCLESGCAISDEILSLMEESDVERRLDECPNIEESLVTNPYLAQMLCSLADEEYVSERMSERVSVEHQAINAQKLVNRINKRRGGTRLRRLLIGASSVAAVLVIIFATFVDDNSVSNQPINLTVVENKPVGAMPILALDNGEQIALDGDTSFVCGDGSVVNSHVGEALSVKGGGKVGSVPDYMTLIVPNKFTYKAILPDGSEVIVNASSELKYPSTFVGGRREVYLKGEAYFSVTKSDKPFIVKVDGADIKVYGTKFNVDARDVINTVLVEGRVGVTVQLEEIMMKPNQLFSYDKSSGERELKEVDTNSYVGWVNGYFCCEQDRLENFLHKLELWYGVKFKFAKDSIKNIEISAMIDNSMELEQTLTVLEATNGNVKFIKEGGLEYIVE